MSEERAAGKGAVFARPTPRVVHEDDEILVVDKPAGTAIQPTDDPEVPALTPQVERWLVARGETPALWLARGLEREASGVVVFARLKPTARRLDEALAGDHRRAWLVGLERKAALRLAQRWRAARLVDEHEDRALLRIEERRKGAPLRKVLAKRGAPPAGDRQGPPATRLMMHRERLTLPSSAGPAPTFEAPEPPAFRRWLHHEELALPDDDGELRARLREAVARRCAIATPDTEGGHGNDVYRLVHGAGDALPGIELDRYGDWAVLALRSDEAVTRREALLDAVADLGVAGVYLKLRPKQANVVVDTRTEDLAPERALRGRDVPSPLIVHEGPLPFEARLGDGLSTGIFLDQRDMRRWLYASSAGKRVLNLFCYHAAFTSAAVAGGAEASVSVDVSAAALARARENLDRLGANPEAHRLIKADASTWLARGQERFDLVILDPPSYATTKRTTFRAARDYPALAAQALRRLAPGGQLLACTNHRGIVRSKFRRQIDEAAKEAGVRIARRRELSPPLDFPAAPGHDPHLKRILVELEPA